MELALLMVGLALCIIETRPPKSSLAQLLVGCLMTMAIIPVVIGCWLVDKVKR